MDREEQIQSALIRYNLKKEKFFKDPMDEYKYFKERIEAISKYSNEFFQNQAYTELTHRYIKAIAVSEDEFDAGPLVGVYRDCLEELGCDSYIMEEEVKNYRKTHGIVKKYNLTVSESAKSHK